MTDYPPPDVVPPSRRYTRQEVLQAIRDGAPIIWPGEIIEGSGEGYFIVPQHMAPNITTIAHLGPDLEEELENANQE